MDDSVTLGLPRNVYDAYRRDFQNGTITLGNLCNAKCFFCSQSMNPPNVIQDYRKFLTFKQVTHFVDNYLHPTRRISIGSAIHLNSGEFFLHPRAADILRSLPPRPINVFTNGMRVTEDHVSALKERGAQLSFSINDASLPNRLAIMGGRMASHEAAFDLLGLLEKHELDYSLWLLPTRSSLDSGELEYSFKQLAPLRRHFCLHTPGFTKFATDHVVRELNIPIEELLELCVFVRGRYCVDVGIENMPSLDAFEGHERYIAARLSESLEALRRSERVGSDEDCLFLCSEAVSKVFPGALAAAGFGRAPWSSVKSTVFGGNVTVAGLLLIEDYLLAVRDHVAIGGRPPQQIVVPRVSFDVNDEDLSMRPLSDLSRETGSAVLLA